MHKEDTKHAHAQCRHGGEHMHTADGKAFCLRARACVLLFLTQRMHTVVSKVAHAY